MWVKAGAHRVGLRGIFTLGPKVYYAISLLIILVYIEILLLGKISKISFIFTLIYLGIAISEFFLLLKTAFTEPGIIPAVKSQNSIKHGEQVQEKTHVNSIVNGVAIESKWCYSCGIYTPPRAKHCQQCQCCIERFDHHCKFLSNCIGARNYRYFFLLLLNTCLLGSFGLIVLLLQTNDLDFGGYILVISTLLGTIISGHLLIYHGKLILRGSTSYEKFIITENNNDQEDQVEYKYPFSLGDWRLNLNAFLSKDVEPSKFNFLTEPYMPPPEEAIIGLSSSSSVSP